MNAVVSVVAWNTADRFFAAVVVSAVAVSVVAAGYVALMRLLYDR